MKQQRLIQKHINMYKEINKLSQLLIINKNEFVR